MDIEKLIDEVFKLGQDQQKQSKNTYSATIALSDQIFQRFNCIKSEISDERDALLAEREQLLAQQVADPTNVWERAVIEAAEAVVRANKTNTGNEPSCSILARDIDALCEILNDNCLGYRPSPAVAVPTRKMLDAARDWSIKTNGIGVGDDQATGCYMAMISAIDQSPRITDHPETILSNASQWSEPITEQDAREIACAFLPYWDSHDMACTASECFDYWAVTSEFGALLNKLNAKPESSKNEIVQYPSGRGVLIIADPDVNGVVIVRDESGEYRRVAKDAIKYESVGG